jgi:glutathione synthase/RimK-type ligase-like ATP-grasp enzyme
MEKVKLLYVLGIDDSNKIEILFLSPNQNNMRFNFRGNVHLIPLIDHTYIDVLRITIGGMKGDPFKIPKVDVIFNSICNPDTNQKSLKVAQNIADTLKLPILNHPKDILKTGRESIYELFKGLNEIIIPKTIRVRPRYLSEVKKLMDDGEISLPFLFREAGYHAGKNLELVQNLDDLRELEKFAFDGRDYYMTQFVDFGSQDGFYRKYRVIVIGGQPYPRHLIVSDLWNVHAESRKKVMTHRSEFLEEEKVFLRDFNEKDLSAFRKFYEMLELDFFGVDFTYARDGRMVVFEINSCFRAIVDVENQPSEHSERGYDYHKPYIENIKKAIESLILEKAG